MAQLSSSSSLTSKVAIRKHLSASSSVGISGDADDSACNDRVVEQQIVCLVPLSTIVMDCIIELCISLIERRALKGVRSGDSDFCLLETVQRGIAPLTLITPDESKDEGSVSGNSETRLVLLLWLKQHVLDQPATESGCCIAHFNPNCAFCQGFFRPNVLAMQKWIIAAHLSSSSSPSAVFVIDQNNKYLPSPSFPSNNNTTTTMIPRSTIRGALHYWRSKYQMKVKRTFFQSWSSYALDPYKREERSLQSAFLRGCTKALNIRRVALRHQRAANMKLQRTVMMAWWQYSHLVAPLVKRRDMERKRACLRKMAGVRLERLASEYSTTQLRVRVLRTWREAYWDVRYHKNLLSKILNIGVNKAKISRFGRDRYMWPVFQIMKAKTILGQAKLHAEASRHNQLQQQRLYLGGDTATAAGGGVKRINSHNISTNTITVEDVLYGGGEGSLHHNNNLSLYPSYQRPTTSYAPYSLPPNRTIILGGFHKSIFRPWRKSMHSKERARNYLSVNDPTNWLLGRNHTLQSGAFALWRQAFMNRRAKVFRAHMLEKMVARRIHKMVAMRVAERTVDANRDHWSKKSILRKWHSLAIIDRPQQRKNAEYLQRWLLRSALGRWRGRYEGRKHQTANVRLALEHRRLTLLSLTFSKKWIPRAKDAIKIRIFLQQKTSNMVEGVLFKWSLAASKQGSARRKEEDVADWFHRTVMRGRILQRWMLKTSQRRASMWFSGVGEKGKDSNALTGTNMGTSTTLHVAIAAKESDSERLKNVLLRQTLNGGLLGNDMRRLRQTREVALKMPVETPSLPAPTDDDTDQSSHIILSKTATVVEKRRQALTFLSEGSSNIEASPTDNCLNTSTSPFFDGPFDVADSSRFQRLLRGAFKQWRSEWYVRQMIPREANHTYASQPSSGLNVSEVDTNRSRHNILHRSTNTTNPTGVEPSNAYNYRSVHQRYHTVQPIEDHEVSIEISPSTMPRYNIVANNMDVRPSPSTVPQQHQTIRRTSNQPQQVYITNARPPLSALLKSVLQS